MNIFLDRFIYRGALPAYHVYHSILTWEVSDIQIQRIALFFLVVLLVGLHKFILLSRIKLSGKGYELQGTIVMVLIFWLNCYSGNEYRYTQRYHTFQTIIFFFIMVTNIFGYFLLMLTSLFRKIFLQERQLQQLLTDSQFNSLQVFIPKIHQKIQCPICLEQLQTSEGGLKLPCQHIYHKQCIKAWLQTKSICPSCRADLKQLISNSQ